MVVGRLVDANSPENYGRVIPVSADHPSNVVDGDELPGFGTDVLPAGDLFED